MRIIKNDTCFDSNRRRKDFACGYIFASVWVKMSDFCPNSMHISGWTRRQWPVSTLCRVKIQRIRLRYAVFSVDMHVVSWSCITSESNMGTNTPRELSLHVNLTHAATWKSRFDQFFEPLNFRRCSRNLPMHQPVMQRPVMILNRKFKMHCCCVEDVYGRNNGYHFNEPMT